VSIQDKRIGFLGGGNIGEALIRGLTKTGLVPAEHVLVGDVRGERLEELRRLYGVLVTPDNVTLELLKLANVGPNDYVIDLGSGDGRIVIVAAKRFLRIAPPGDAAWRRPDATLTSGAERPAPR